MRIIVQVIMWFAILTLSGGFSTVSAASISQVDGNSSMGVLANQIWGQSFTATGTEDLTSIEMASDESGTITLRIYNGETACETTPGNGVPTASAISTTAGLAFPDTNPVNGADVSAFFSTLTPSAPVAMTNGQQYTFCFEVTTGSLLIPYDNDSDTYAGGKLYRGLLTFGFNAIANFAFRINVAPTGAGGGSVNAPFAPLALGLLFGSLGLVGFFGRRFAK